MNKRTQRLWNDEVALIVEEAGETDSGYPTDSTETSRSIVLANKLSVQRAEFYAAAQNSMKVDQVFEVHAFEYNGEKLLEHDGKRYEIVRTYQAEPEYIELTCSVMPQTGV
ncbi:phage head closure protein [Paenibacillus alvei]|uniref:Phage head closure protein n=1 Tax=Paenibacillus alvei TaxID=44250 RepID=A0AAP7A6P8_PAEAL|nr:phage head closure protein [Paenibacillus alvei]